MSHEILLLLLHSERVGRQSVLVCWRDSLVMYCDTICIFVSKLRGHLTNSLKKVNYTERFIWNASQLGNAVLLSPVITRMLSVRKTHTWFFYSGAVYKSVFVLLGDQSALIGGFYRRFEKAYRSHLQGSSICKEFFLACLTLAEGTDRLSRNVGNYLPLKKAWRTRRTNTTQTFYRDHALPMR
jgi:hypothetical protein